MSERRSRRISAGSFLERANAGDVDVDGVAALYETDAVLANPPGRVTVGLKQLGWFTNNCLLQAGFHR